MAMEYTLLRSDRKTLAVEITREGKVLVRAPRFLSRGRIESFLQEKTAWILQHQKQVLARLEAFPEPSEAEEAAYRKAAKALLPELVKRWSERMGLYPEGITITGARTRFGSCSGKNRLSFSWRLMQYPEEAVEYVVVHELSHLKHRNHGPEFYALVARYMPDYKRREKLLKAPPAAAPEPK